LKRCAGSSSTTSTRRPSGCEAADTSLRACRHERLHASVGSTGVPSRHAFDSALLCTLVTIDS
jgi:hypothetical protein